MIPTIKDLVMYVNKAITGIDWNSNWQKVVNWLTSGSFDIKVKTLEIAENGSIINNGSFSQNGDFSVSGNSSVSGNLNVGGKITGDGSGLTNVVSAVQTWNIPFCVNSGNVDNNGNGDLFKFTAGVSTEIEMKVSSEEGIYKPIIFTNAKGKTTTLNYINSYNLSQTDNGQYIVYLAENATALTLTDNNRKVFRQPFAPTPEQNPQPSDIWLDTSKLGLVSYIRQSGTWVESNIVPLGEITVDNHTVSNAITYPYNQNGYNINMNSKYLLPRYDSGIDISASVGSGGSFTALSNGFVALTYWCRANQGAASVNISINNSLVALLVRTNADDGKQTNLFLPLNKGDILTVGTGSIEVRLAIFYSSWRQYD